MLTDNKQVKTAKGRPEPYKLADQAGLYLYVSPSGAKSWRYDYRVVGRRHTLTIGQYPLIPLKEARDLHTDARRARGEGRQFGARQAAREAGGKARRREFLPRHRRAMDRGPRSRTVRRLAHPGRGVAGK